MLVLVPLYSAEWKRWKRQLTLHNWNELEMKWRQPVQTMVSKTCLQKEGEGGWALQQDETLDKQQGVPEQLREFSFGEKWRDCWDREKGWGSCEMQERNDLFIFSWSSKLDHLFREARGGEGVFSCLYISLLLILEPWS